MANGSDRKAETGREEDLRRIPFRKADPDTWPKGVRVIGPDELDALGVDGDGRLHWHGKPVEITGHRIEFSMGHKIWGIIVALGALTTFIVTSLEATTAIIDWMCKVQWLTSTTYCPVV